MLQCLDYWRTQCSETQLAEFDHQLRLHCGTAVISQSALKTRYHGSYHRALINGKVLLTAVRTRDYIRGSALWGSDIDAGKEFASMLADHDGCLPVKHVDSEYQKSIPLLLQRGILFEHDGYYHLPAEIVIELRGKEQPNSWMTLVAKTPLAMLYQLVPDAAQAAMLKPKAIRNELGAWLASKGIAAHQGDVSAALNDADWTLLLTLHHHDLDDFDELEQLYPDLEPVYVTHHYGYRDGETLSLRKSLEATVPEQLKKLCRLGLIGIRVQHGDERYASICLCDEARKLLEAPLKQVQQRIGRSLKEGWGAEPCDAEQPSAWSMDQHMWRLWITLHFLPMGLTQQGRLRKNELKKIAKLLAVDDVVLIQFLVFSMLRSGLLKQQETQLVPVSVDWKSWSRKLRTAMFNIVRGSQRWDKADEEQVYALLAQLPTGCWLNLDDVVVWLQMHSTGHVVAAEWMELFCEYQNYALHHLNITHRRIYLLPAFHAVLKQSAGQQAPALFTTPGWHGARKQAKTLGFISASGEIQLPPDCNHRVLDKLVPFCSITAIEQMITLQLDQKALQRMASNKAALKQTRRVLESLQSPLPQPIAYLFDKQQAQKPVASAAAGAMVLVLHEPSALQQLAKTGFTFSRPFKNKPEIVVLDASADAEALLKACSEAGILLDTLIKPVAWVSGTAAIRAWMDTNVSRADQWLEIAYQKTRSSKARQLFARIEYDYYGGIRIQLTRKTAQGYAMLKSMVSLEPKHILRLREIDAAEAGELGLDLL